MGSCSLLRAAAVLPLLLAASPAAAAPWLIVPVHDASGGTETQFWIDLGTGAAFAADPRRGGEVLRLRRLEQNLFAAIGRRLDQPAARGHFLLGPIRDRGGETDALLLAETNTGYMAILSRLGRGGVLGELRTVSGRPGARLASEDGNYALLMRRGPGGSTDAAYLIHGSSGGCIRLGGLDRLQDEPTAERCPSLPSLDLAGDPVALERPEGATTAFLLAAGARGTIHRIGLPSGSGALAVTASDLHLAELFGNAEAGERRFAMAPIRTEGGGTRGILVADPASGRLALLGNLVEEKPTARVLTRDLRRSFPAADRALEMVPRESGFAATLGIWVIDPAVGRAVLVDDPLEGGRLRIRPVDLQR